MIPGGPAHDPAVLRRAALAQYADEMGVQTDDLERDLAPVWERLPASRREDRLRHAAATIDAYLDAAGFEVEYEGYVRGQRQTRLSPDGMHDAHVRLVGPWASVEDPDR